MLILKDWGLPFITALAGIIGLFFGKEKAWARNILLSGLIITAGISIWFNSSDRSRALIEQQKKDAAQKLELENLGQISAGVNQLKDLLAQSGLRPEVVTAVNTSIEANKARQEILPAVRSESRSKPQILYFPKQVDPVKVVQALEEVGFTVDTKNAPQPSIPTNKVWIGKDVSVNDAKFVALTLIRAGVQIKAIRRFKEDGGQKANQIQVGASPNLPEAKPLTVETVQALKTIPRDEF